jgi:hypothetical protein
MTSDNKFDCVCFVFNRGRNAFISKHSLSKLQILVASKRFHWDDLKKEFPRENEVIMCVLFIRTRLIFHLQRVINVGCTAISYSSITGFKAIREFRIKTLAICETWHYCSSSFKLII